MDREGEYKRTIVKVPKLAKRHQNRGPHLSPGQAHQKPAYRVGGVRHRNGAISIWALRRNCGNSGHDAKEEGQVKESETESTDAWVEDGPICISVDAPVIGAERRDRIASAESAANSFERMNC